MIKVLQYKSFEFIDPQNEAIPGLEVLEIGPSIYGVPLPDWLLIEDFYAPVWILQDGIRPDHKTVKINFDTIMPDKRSLLDHNTLVNTIKFCVILARNGKSSMRFTDKADTQKKFAQHLIIIAKWLNLNELEFFSDLSTTHIRRLKREWAYGTYNLLKLRERYYEKVLEYRESNIPLPTVKGNAVKPVLDNATICREAGFDLESWPKGDSYGHHTRIRVALEEGCYLPPYNRNIELEDQNLEPKLGSAGTLQHKYKSLHYLWKASSITRKYGLDYLSVRPFPDSSYSKEAKTNGSASGHYKTIPEPIALDFIDKCIRWVVDYGTELLDLKDCVVARYKEDTKKFSEKSKRKSKMASYNLAVYKPKNRGIADPWPVIGFLKNNFKSLKFNGEKRKSVTCKKEAKLLEIVELNTNEGRRPQASLQVLVNGFLPVACVVVIVAFTARRKIESELLQVGCVEMRNSELWINMYSAKGKREYDDFPTVRIVEMAVELLERWSEEARQITGKPFLLQYKDLLTDEVSDWEWYKHINDFAEFVEIQKDKDGTPWKISEHQLRRFFAMMFFWRYDVSELSALSYHLRHADLDMTLEYIREIVSGDVFNEIGLRKQYQMWNQVNRGESDLVGPMADYIKERIKEYNILVSKRIYSGREASFEKWVKRHIDEVGYVLDFKRWGLCFGKTPSRKAYSNCLVNGELNIKKAVREQCKDCPNFATHDRLLKREFKDSEPQPSPGRSVCESPLFQAVLEAGLPN